MKRIDSAALEARLAELGLSQSAVADRLGCSREAVSQWMLGKSFPRPRALLELASITGLSFDRLVVAEAVNGPQYAYRNHRNAKLTDDLRERAEDMVAALQQMLPCFRFETSFAPPLLSEPRNEKAYIDEVARELREACGCRGGEPMQEQRILRYFDRLRTVFIPVLWGEKGPNGLHIGLKGNTANFVYVNVQTKLSDFKYWLVHELAHVLTPSLSEEDGESFAEGLSGVILFPGEAAAEFLEQLDRAPTAGAIVNAVIDKASTFGISPVTVWRRTREYAEAHGIRLEDLNIYGAASNYDKTVKTLAAVLFGEEIPSVEKYIADSASWFGTRFFDGLKTYIRAEGKGPSSVQRVLGVSMSDAKGVWDYLAHP
jgi:transcriptional regulator with XRE-family HTH domain